MTFRTCANCLGLHTASLDRCPICGADEVGAGAEHPFDAETRSTIGALGGIFGGILEGPEPNTLLLWCSRGLILEDRNVGLRWRARVPSGIQDVRVRADTIELSVSRTTLRLCAEDGQQLEESSPP